MTRWRNCCTTTAQSMPIAAPIRLGCPSFGKGQKQHTLREHTEAERQERRTKKKEKNILGTVCGSEVRRCRAAVLIGSPTSMALPLCRTLPPQQHRGFQSWLPFGAQAGLVPSFFRQQKVRFRPVGNWLAPADLRVLFTDAASSPQVFGAAWTALTVQYSTALR